MSKYFIDTEFTEGFKKPIKWLPTIGKFNKPYHSLELISIGIVGEDGRSYYAISKDFDLDWAWNKYELKEEFDYINSGLGKFPTIEKVYWLRENVLKSIFYDWYPSKDIKGIIHCEGICTSSNVGKDFTFKNLKKLIKGYGKSKNQIAKEIKEFCLIGIVDYERISKEKREKEFPHYFPEFYAYYADYDWVIFCSLFGTMMDLPKGFPMYCKDLKQMLDEKQKKCDEYDKTYPNTDMYGKLEDNFNYPKQTNEHNALADAKWNKQLYDFLQKI
jgi:hypothetical protein